MEKAVWDSATWYGWGVRGWTVIAGVLFVSTVRAGVVELPGPGSGQWQAISLPRVERETQYEVVESEIGPAFRAMAECSASGMGVMADGVDLASTPVLEWRWKVVSGLPSREERSKAGDDFPARVYVTFPLRDDASFWERLRHRAGETLYGESIPGAAINYVWSAREPAGASWDNPFVAESKMVSMGDGPLGEWRTQRANVRADYERLFGEKPPPLTAVVIMSDADNTCSAAEAYFGGFRFREEGKESAGRGIQPRSHEEEVR